MKRNRNYFFTGPTGATGTKFLVGNFPPELTFRDLLDSIPMFSETGDTASAIQQGLVKISTDANAYNRTVVSGITEAVMPWQLPNLELTANGGSTHTEAVYGGSALQIGGLLLKPVEVTRGSNKALNFAIAFDPGNLPIKGPGVGPAVTDYIVILDVATGYGARVLVSDFLTVSGYWTLDGTILLPSGSYDLNMGTGMSYLANVQLDATANRTLAMNVTSSATGKSLSIAGSSVSGGTFAGGNLYLYGGTGTGGADNGGVLLAFNGSNPVGNVGIGGTQSATYRLKVSGSVHITQNLLVEGMAGSGGGIGVLDNNGLFSHQTFLVARGNILPSGTDGKIIVYNTGVWTAAALSGHVLIDKTGATTIQSGVIVASMVHATADIPTSAIYCSNANRVIVSNSSTGRLEGSSVLQDDLDLIGGLAANGNVVTDFETIKGIKDVVVISATGLKVVTGYSLILDGGLSENLRRIDVSSETVLSNDSVIVLEIGAGATTLNLPDFTTRPRMSYEFIVDITAGGNIVFDTYGTQNISYGGSLATTATIVAPTANTVIRLICDSVAGAWIIGVS